jgi:hypothetical protein
MVRKKLTLLGTVEGFRVLIFDKEGNEIYLTWFVTFINLSILVFLDVILYSIQ